LTEGNSVHRFALLLLFVATAIPTQAAKRVTVDELERVLSASKGQPDAEVARHLSSLELTERLSSTRLSHWKTDLPGEKAQRALVALADMSAFLNPPAAEIPATATPSFAEQRRIMGQVVAYVRKTNSQFPNVLATRDTTRFEGSPLDYPGQEIATTNYRPLHVVSRSSATVSYSSGRDVVDEDAAKGKKSGAPEEGLRTWGVFGPMLSTVLLDAAQNKLVWSHWEQGTGGQLAVFSYVVPSEKSHYEVDFCCVPNSEGAGTHVFQRLAGYHGEITADPATGTILRIMVEAELNATEPVTRASIAVEYGSVEMGGKTYICPQKSIGLSLAQSSRAVQELPLNTRPLGLGGTFTPSVHSQIQNPSASSESQQTLLNDVAFGQYHLPGAEASVVTGNDVKPASGSPPLK